MTPASHLAEICNQSKQGLLAAYFGSPQPRHQHLAQRLSECGHGVTWTNVETGEVGVGIQRCGLRACFRCQCYEQRQTVRKSRPWLRDLVLSHEHQILYISIGFPNVDVEQVKCRLKQINRQLAQLRRKENMSWPGLGDITSREFTINSDSSVHLNSHSLVAVDAGFSKCSFPGLREEIRKRFDLPAYDSIHIQCVRGNSRSEIFRNFMRAYWYGLKPWPFHENPETGILLADELYGFRRHSVAGVFRTHRSVFMKHQGEPR